MFDSEVGGKLPLKELASGVKATDLCDVGNASEPVVHNRLLFDLRHSTKPTNFVFVPTEIPHSEIPVNSIRENNYKILGAWWCLPVRARWIDQNDVAEITAAIPLLQCQLAVLKETFKDSNYDGTAFWVLRNRLESVGAPIGETELESCVIWHPPPAKVTIRPDTDPDTEAMLSDLVSRGFFKSVEQADALRRVFLKAIVDTLLNKKKPVDMLFFRLWPVPYRANWKTIIMGRDLLDPEVGTMDAVLESGKLLAVSTIRMQEERAKDKGWKQLRISHRINWTLECEYYPAWWRLVASVEKRAKAMTKGHYAVAVVRTLRHFKETGAKLYKQFLEQTHRCNATFTYQGKSNHPTSLRPQSKEPRRNDDPLLPELPVDGDLPAVVGRKGRSQDCVAIDLPETEGDLPSMPHL